MRKTFVTLSLLAAMSVPALLAERFVPEVGPVVDIGAAPAKPTVVPFAGVTKYNVPRRSADSRPGFTADVPAAHAATWTENFDGGSLKAWTVDPTQNVKWSVKSTFGTNHSFGDINPDDLNSLYVEGPYQVFKREISSVTSSKIDVPVNGALQGYVGYSLNYDDQCRLVISVSDDDFETSAEVWNSKDGGGVKTWEWKQFKADLSQWAGKSVAIRLTYSWGSSDETFKTGGYMGDFYIDDLRMTGLAPVDGVDVTTGELIRFVSLVEGADSYKWTLPGAVPSESTVAAPEVYYTADGTYDVTFEAVVGGETVSSTIPAFVTVTGTEPVAKILPPATFRYYPTGSYMVAPLGDVTFSDASAGFPTERHWIFGGINADDSEALTELEGEAPTVNYMFRHEWPVGLAVGNEHGASNDIITVSAEYDGAISNFNVKEDRATNFDMGDWGVFPGSNTHKITRYAERFSCPSRPMRVVGCSVFFTESPSEVPITENNSIGVYLYTSENGLPGKMLDCWWWTVIDLDRPTAGGDIVGTWFEFPEVPVVDDEFFIVIDGIPELSETCKVSFAMAGFRNSGNTALMEIDGKWKEVDEYFGAGHCTSYLVQPVIAHSVMTSLPVGNDEIRFSNAGGRQSHQFFSILGYEDPIVSDADWCRVVSEFNGTTVNDIEIECDPLTGTVDRTAKLTLTDGVCTHVLTVVQSASSGVGEILPDSETSVEVAPAVFSDRFTVSYPEGSSMIQVVDLAGRLVYSAPIAAGTTAASVDASTWASGLYIILVDDIPVKAAKR